MNGCRLLFKRGLDRNYVELCEEYIGIKGKIDFRQSLNKNLFRQGRSICQFDGFESDILQNQLLKATILHLTKIEAIDKDLKREIWDCYYRFSSICDINIQLSHFSQIRIHRNNSFYDLLLKVCRLIFENSVLDEKSGRYHFKEFLGSDKDMARLFESFVRNFYKREQTYFQVRQEDITWDASPVGGSSMDYLPKMQTDVTLESNDRKIIIDTKFYSEALVSRYGNEKIRSNNLYQLYSYLRNIEKKPNILLNGTCEGVLLYPTVEYSLDEKFNFGSHFIRIKTLNLNSDWRNIRAELLSICNEY